MDAHSLAGLLQLGHLRIEENGLEQALEAFVQRFDKIAVHAGQQASGHFDDGDGATQGGVDRAQLQADVAAADDEQRSRHALQLQRLRGGHHARTVQLEDARSHGAGAGGEDAMAEAQPGTIGELKSLAIGELSVAVDVFDTALLTQTGKAASERIDNLVPVLADAIDVNLRRREGDAERAGVAGIGDETGSVKEGLGGDAADVRRVPPGLSASLTRVTFMPLSAARKAAASPPGPPPTTTSSLSLTSAMRLSLRSWRRRLIDALSATEASDSVSKGRRPCWRGGLRRPAAARSASKGRRVGSG